MRFTRAIPPGPDVAPESVWTGMALERGALPHRPYVVCNFVSSVDGRARVEGRTAKLGGDGDLAVFRLLRTQVDAVMAGTETLRVERYGVMVGNEERQRLRVAEGRSEQPLAVIVSRSGRVPFEIPLFADPRSRVALYAPADTEIPECRAHVQRYPLPTDPQSQLADVLRSLRDDHDVRSLLCEGGPTVFEALLAQELVDELFLTLAPSLVGGEPFGITRGPGLRPARDLRLVSALARDSHLFLRYARP
ncbi:MAG: dihydrofolate reductase family protein [Solirubrobacteraceae bacterium]